MSKSVNQDNSRNRKNLVDDVTPLIPHKSINADKSVNDSNIQSNNRFATPADIIHRDNEKELAQSSEIFINKDIITLSSTLHSGSQTNTPQNVMSKTEYNHRTSSSPITQVPEKPTIKTFISKDRPKS